MHTRRSVASILRIKPAGTGLMQATFEAREGLSDLLLRGEQRLGVRSWRHGGKRGGTGCRGG